MSAVFAAVLAAAIVAGLAAVILIPAATEALRGLFP